MGLHNLCEGIVVAAMGATISPLVFIAAIAHKLPEGMVIFSLADGISTPRRWMLAIASALLIPAGAMVVMPENLMQSTLALASGILFVVLCKALFSSVTAQSSAPHATPSRSAIAAATFAGVAVAGLSILVV